MQPPLEVGQLFTPSMAQERGYPLLRDIGSAQLYQIDGKGRPTVYMVLRENRIVTLTLHSRLARLALYVV
jgi:hypothetical protein